MVHFLNLYEDRTKFSTTLEYVGNGLLCDMKIRNEKIGFSLITLKKKKFFRKETDTCTGTKFSTRVHEMETISCVLLYNWII